MVKVNVNMMIKVKVTMLLKVKVIKQVNTTFITTKQYNIYDFQTLIYRHTRQTTTINGYSLISS